MRPNEVTLKLGNGASVAAKAIGSTSIDLLDHILLLDNVLYIPNAFKNICSGVVGRRRRRQQRDGRRCERSGEQAHEGTAGGGGRAHGRSSTVRAGPGGGWTKGAGGLSGH